MSDRLSQMLGMQRDLQVQAYGRDPGQMDTDEKIQFIKDMVLALTDELHELLAETDWKPWTQGDRKINYDGAKKELVDCWHFFQNIQIALGMSTDELYKSYVKKRQVNADRQANGYDGRTTKCPGCRRALEDVSLTDIKLSGSNITDVVMCQCGEIIPLEIAQPFLND